MEKTKETIEMIQQLPEPDQELIHEIVKKLILAWDPDYTKLTPKEAEELENSDDGRRYSHEEAWK